MTYDTIPNFIYNKCKKNSGSVVFWQKKYKWHPVTWKKFWEDLSSMAYYCKYSLKVKHQEKVALIMHTRYEWEVCEKALMHIGAIVVGLDPKASTSELLDTCKRLSIRKVIAGEKDKITDLGLKGIATDENIFSEILLSKMPIPKCNVKGEDYATIIQTSGVSGKPKLIAYKNHQIIMAAYSIIEHFSHIQNIRKTICWLPLFNLTSKVHNLVNMYIGAEIYFVTEPKKIIREMRSIEPDYFLGVPRFYEKLYSEIVSELKSSFSGRLALVLLWLKSGPFQKLLDRVFYNKIRKSIGASNMQFMLSGSAKTSENILYFFSKMNLLICEAYALSENVVPISMNTCEDYKFGSVGKPLRKNTVKIVDKEICVRGQGVFEGYLCGSNATFDKDGYYYTGDLGELDDDGYLWLIGRKKDIIKTSTGYKISPEEVEGHFRKLHWIEDIIVLGDGRKYLSALIVPVAGLKKKQIERSIRTENSKLSDFKQIKNYAILEKGFSVENGEVTRSLKLRRKAIESKYKKLIEGLYS